MRHWKIMTIGLIFVTLLMVALVTRLISVSVLLGATVVVLLVILLYWWKRFKQICKQRQEFVELSKQQRASEEHLRAANQQLQAANQQVVAHQQQLTAANQQLLAANQQLKANEDKLSASEQRYRAIVESIPLGMHLYHLDGDDNLVLYSANRAANSILGIDHEPLYNKTIEEAFSALAQTEVPAIYRNVAKNGDLWHNEQINYKDENIVGAFDVFAFQTLPGQMVAAFLDITDRIKMREALKESEHRLRTIYAAAPAAICYLAEGKVKEVNGYYTELTGYTREESLGGALRFLTVDGDNEAVLTRLVADSAHRALCSAEVSGCCKDGTRVDVMMNVASVNQADTLQGHTVVLVDISSRKQVERELRERETAYRMLAENLPGSVYRRMLQPYEQMQFFNNKIYSLTGYTPDEFLVDGKSRFDDLVVAQDLPRKKMLLEQSIKDVQPFEIEYTIRHKSGELRSLSERATPVVSETGVGRFVDGVIFDITERRQMEEILRFTQYSIDHIADAAIWIGADAHIFYANQAACRHLGTTREAVLHLPISRISSRFSEARWPAHWKKLEAQGTIIGESISVISDGRTIPVEIAENFVRFEGKEFDCVFLRDVTQRKKVEAELGKTQRLESLGILAGGIAHDFNNMLSGLFGYIDLARSSECANPQTVSYLSSAMEAYQRTKMLTQQLLTFAKGGAPLCAVFELGKTILASCSFALSGSNVSHTLEMGECDLFVDADEGQISQVFNNLLINSRQAMPDGGVVSITVNKQDVTAASVLSLDTGAYVKIVIHDTGVGIDPMVLPNIFDPFFTTKKEGSGLGLATAHSIIKKHGGSIMVESKVNHGAAFSVYLPIAADAPVVASQKTTPEAMAVTTGGRILVMDDEKVIRDLAAALLRKLKYHVETVADGTEACKRYQEEFQAGTPFDLVILDLTVPGGKGGKETVSLLLDIDPTVKAIVSSGYSDDPIMAECRKYGFTAAIPKPYRLNDLVTVITQIIGTNG